MIARGLSGWGRYPRLDCRVDSARTVPDVGRAVAVASTLIARGCGRAYGDCALNPAATLLMTGLDRLLAFDAGTGLLTCEAGVTMGDIVATFVPRGWFPTVTPGTKFVTVGGAIAADVHGKNHHRDGSFCDHVTAVELLLADGTMTVCGPDREPELFMATRGGMGMTGVILRATFRLRPIDTAWICEESCRAGDLDDIMALFRDSAGWSYSVAWIDCQARGSRLGRAVLMRGEHARRDELPPSLAKAPLAAPRSLALSVPFDGPSCLLNRTTISAFNELFYRTRRPGSRLRGLESFFYPLDGLLAWNRLYGHRGFFQYQCVLPLEAGAAGLSRLLERVAESGCGSFLAVLKLLGSQDGLMSFPLRGYTLALDFPLCRESFSLAARLDAIVADHGGRLYLAKDARMAPTLFRRGYPGLDRFRALKAAHDPRRLFRSVQSERLGYD